jgi:hypothetical protein
MSQPTLAPPAPALAEIEEALVPALIVEKLEDGSLYCAGPVGADADGRERSISSRPSGCVRLTCRLPSRSRCSRNGAPARVNSFGPCKRQSHPRPRRRSPDQPCLFTAARRSSAKFGMDRKALRIPVDSATVGVFCASQQARLAVVRALI